MILHSLKPHKCQKNIITSTLSLTTNNTQLFFANRWENTKGSNQSFQTHHITKAPEKGAFVMWCVWKDYRPLPCGQPYGLPSVVKNHS